MTSIDKAIERAAYNYDEAKLRRKEDQAWECAGCARQDNDMKDAERWTNLARMYARVRKEIYG